MNKYELLPEIHEAMDILDIERKKAETDSSRPKYHYASPAHLMVDVWGGIYHNDRYHIFYDINYDDNPERMNGAIGHLVSDNMIDWEELPMAFAPLKDKREIALNDGCITITPDGKPLIWYTRKFYKEFMPVHIPAYGTDDLVHWERLEDYAITMHNHGGPLYKKWTDPLIFSENGRYFMIISSCTLSRDGDMVIDWRAHPDDRLPIYEATDDTLLNWEYRGNMADHTGEVCNFIKIRDKWVLIYSPYDKPKYFVGTFDTETFRFNCENEGILSYGYIQQGCNGDLSRGFYATSSFYGKDGNTYIIGWITGFDNPKGWDGCVSLPRVLDLDENNRIIMKPAPQIKELRKDKIAIIDIDEIECTKCFELNLRAKLKDGETVVMECKDYFRLEVQNNKAKFNEIEAEFESFETTEINMYIDVTTSEIFFNGGRSSITRCFKEIGEDARLAVKCTGEIEKLEMYSLRNI